MDIKDIIYLVFDEYNFTIPTNTKGITKEVLIDFILSEQSCSCGALGYTSSFIWKYFTYKVFPDKRTSQYKNCTYKTYLLSLLELKQCGKCNLVLDFSEFHSGVGKTNNLASQCKDCERKIQKIIGASRQARRRFAKLLRVPEWADLKRIREFYKGCPEGYQVDHIIPLQGELVSGLHVLNNLQYLMASENASKNNKFIIV